MARIFLTQHLRRFAEDDPYDLEAATLWDALEALFARQPQLRGYILDEQDRLRQHVLIFVDEQQTDPGAERDLPLTPESEIYIMQSLSGGGYRDARTADQHL